MATKEEWREYFELVNNRKPTLEEFQAAIANGEISSNLTEAKMSLSNLTAQPTILPSSVVPQKKSRKWFWAFIVAAVVAIGLTGVIVVPKIQLSVLAAQSGKLTESQIENYMNSIGYHKLGHENQSAKTYDERNQTTTFNGKSGFYKDIYLYNPSNQRSMTFEVASIPWSHGEVVIPAKAWAIEISGGNPTKTEIQKISVLTDLRQIPKSGDW